MHHCKTVLFPAIGIRGMKGKGICSLGGKESLSLQLMQVRSQEGGSRWDNLVLLFECLLAPHQPAVPQGSLI